MKSTASNEPPEHPSGAAADPVAEGPSMRDPVAAFRRATQRGGVQHEPLGLREWLMTVTLVLSLCVPPWLLGGMRFWAQMWMFGLACVPFLLLWVPLPGESGRVSAHLRCLLRFPVFWLGALFLLYISIQSWNVNWEYVLSHDGRQWWMMGVAEGDYIAWLPTGMAAPFEQMNGWRVVMIFAAVFFWVCAFWAGLQRRRTVMIVLWALALNGFAAGMLLILQKLTGTVDFFWTFPDFIKNPAGPFINRNHAGAYLNATMGVQLGLFLYYNARAQRTVGRSSPHLLFLFLVLVQIVALLFSASRGALLTAIPLVSVGFLAFVGQSLIGGRRGVLLATLALIFTAGTVYFLWPVVQKSFPLLEQRWQQTWRTLDSDELDRDKRVIATRATYRMFQDNPWTGWGAGSFRWYFPVYQQQEEEIYRVVDRRGRVRRTFLWHQAHNDWLQYPAEYGIIGCIPLLLIVAFWILYPLRYVRHCGAWVLLPLLGGLCVMAHAVVDFPLQNPPILIALACAFAMPAKMLAVRQAPRRSRLPHAQPGLDSTPD